MTYGLTMNSFANVVFPHKKQPQTGLHKSSFMRKSLSTSIEILISIVAVCIYWLPSDYVNEIHSIDNQ